MELGMKKFTVRRFFSVYLRKKSRSKSSSLSRLEVKASPGDARVPVPAPGVGVCRKLPYWLSADGHPMPRPGT